MFHLFGLSDLHWLFSRRRFEEWWLGWVLCLVWDYYVYHAFHHLYHCVFCICILHAGCYTNGDNQDIAECFRAAATIHRQRPTHVCTLPINLHRQLKTVVSPLSCVWERPDLPFHVGSGNRLIMMWYWRKASDLFIYYFYRYFHFSCGIISLKSDFSEFIVKFSWGKVIGWTQSSEFIIFFSRYSYFDRL